MKNLPLKYGAIMFRRGIAPIVVIVALALLALFGGATVVAWRTPLLDPYLPQTIKTFFGRPAYGVPTQPPASDRTDPGSQLSEQQVEDLTKDWKTYVNEELGLSFKYPRDWVVEEYAYGGVLFPAGFLVYIIPPGAARADPRNIQFSYVSDLNSYYPTVREWVKKGNPYETAPFFYFGGREWIQATNVGEEIEGFGRVFYLYTEGKGKRVFEFFFNESRDQEFNVVIELVASTIEFF